MDQFAHEQGIAVVYPQGLVNSIGYTRGMLGLTGIFQILMM